MQITRLHAFSDNYIWLLANEQQAIVVDPGDAEPVLSYLKQHDLQLVALLITHHHHDHTGGIQALRAATGCAVYGPAKEAINGVEHALSAGNIVQPTEHFPSFEVIECPGHTLGHIAFYSAPYLFCGDTLFAGGCGRMFEGTPTQFSASLSKIASLPKDTQIFCAHEYTQSNLKFALAVEPNNAELAARIQHTRALREQNQATVPSILEIELATNPFLRTESKNVIKAAEKHAQQPLSSKEEVFRVLREWKDSF